MLLPRLMKPVNNNICVVPFEAEGSKALFIPPVFLRKGQTAVRGRVKASASPEVSAGEVVVFQKHAGAEIEYRGEKFVMIKANAIIAIE